MIYIHVPSNNNIIWIQIHDCACLSYWQELMFFIRFFTYLFPKEECKVKMVSSSSALNVPLFNPGLK